MGKFLFSQPDNAVLDDTTLHSTVYRIYNLLKKHAGNSNTTIIKVKTLAREAGCCVRTVRYALATLGEKGIVEREARKSPYDPKHNLANLYIIHGRNAKCYTEASVAQITEFPTLLQSGAPITATHCREELEIIVPDLKTKETNIREAETSQVVLPSTSEQKDVEARKPLETTETRLNETDCGKPEVQLPKQKTMIRTEARKKPETAKYDLSGVPDILHPTAILYLSQTGRTELTEKDRGILCELLEKHTPTRINREILDKLKLFKELGRTPRQMTLSYIYVILKDQRSIVDDEPEVNEPQAEAPVEVYPDTASQIVAVYERITGKKKRATGNRKGAKRTPKAEHREQSVPEVPAEPVELAMPVAEAEKVIADYEAEHAKPAEPEPAIPAALEELFTKMQEKENQRVDEYFEALPKDEDGCYVLPEEDELGNMSLEDYLHLKYPEAEEEELHRDYSGQIYGEICEHKEIARLQTAFDIDYACAMCMNPEACQLPEGCMKGQPKLETKMCTGKDGKKFLGTGFEGCIKCKHNRPKPAEKTPEQKRQEAEFEHMMSRSGITPFQREKTFDSLKPETPEMIAAKAMAILAAKTGRNLVLAGNAGTGKTHLAVSIAIEAMKKGRRARVITACEMLDEICQANRDNTDPFGTVLKYKSVPVLVIDDWDKARMTEARFDYLYQIINDRYTKGLQTIVTTNAYDMVGLEHRFYAGKIEPIMSRLLENGDWVMITETENYRLKSAPDTLPIEREVVPIEQPAEQPKVKPEELRVSDDTTLEAPKPDVEELEAEALAEFAEIEAEMQSPEYQLAEEAVAEVEAERIKCDSEPSVKTWQEIEQSSEYQALSECDKLKKQWEYLRETPEYKNLGDYDRITVQLDFGRRIREAEQLAQERPQPEQKAEEHQVQTTAPEAPLVPKTPPELTEPKLPHCEALPSGGFVIHIPHYDDGLDDDDGDVKL